MSNLKDLFMIRKDITFLNFGSFGACPKPIFEEYQNWQLELEQEPIQFITVNGLKYMKSSREALATYINCNPDDLVLVTNPSYAVNIIAKGLKLSPGDEVLTTNIEYGACDKTWSYYCATAKANYVRQPIQLPITSKQDLIDDLFKGLSKQTKVLFISHITSSTGLILPVKEICSRAKQHGLLTIVDGAHAPAHVDLDLSTLEADVYIGACHKWMMSPKGCSFLYVKPELQSGFDPLVISWGFKAMFPSHSQFLDYHQMQGTRDFSAFLTIPSCIRFMEQHHWKEVSATCRQLVLSNALRFCDLLNTNPISPISSEFIGQMFSIPVNTHEPEQLQKLLFDKYRIEIPVMRQDEKVFIRYSINAFNTQEDLDMLYEALSDIKLTKNLIK